MEVIMRSDMVKLSEAMQIAARCADASSIPQTIYRAKGTCGWTNTWNGARLLDGNGVQMRVTILPTRYFVS